MNFLIILSYPKSKTIQKKHYSFYLYIFLTDIGLLLTSNSFGLKYQIYSKLKMILLKMMSLVKGF